VAIEETGVNGLRGSRVSPDPKIFFAVVMLGAVPNNLLALPWRERIKVRAVHLDFALTLALSREREREIADVGSKFISDRG